MFDRGARGHLGFCYDMDFEIDASNLVYNMTWAALVWALGLGAPWREKSPAAAAEPLSPHAQGAAAQPQT
eukprot:5084184-Pyramimonas_sp.AAC.1